MSDEMIYTMANTKIFISENPVRAKLEVTPEDFQGINWIEIKGLFNVGELGAEQGVNEYELINSDWVMKSKGSRNGGTMTNTFVPLHLDPGQTKVREAVEDKCRPYGFRVERGADCTPESIVTISIADPGEVTWNDHGFQIGQPIMFTLGDGGTLPNELTAGTVYYVAAVPTDNTFALAATPGGEIIETTGTTTGDIIATAPPAGMTQLFQGFALDGVRSGGARNDNYTRTYPVAVNGAIIEV